jgi:tRNA (guanine-N7-)-methyltransferase
MEARRNDLRDRFAAIFPPGTPPRFTWEIGCGHGHFLTAYAQAHPNEICIGVDIVSERIERAVRKRDRAKLANLHFIHAEARLFLETLPAEARFTRLFILFPDPWPKARHHKHRIMQPDFLADAAKRAGEGARLYFRTDFTPYYKDTELVFNSHPDWELVPVLPSIPNAITSDIRAEPWPYEQETVFQARAESYHSLIAKPRKEKG